MREFYVSYVLPCATTTEQQDSMWSEKDVSPGVRGGYGFVSMECSGKTGFEAAKDGALFLMRHGVGVLGLDAMTITGDYADLGLEELTTEDRDRFKDWLDMRPNL